MLHVSAHSAIVRQRPYVCQGDVILAANRYSIDVRLPAIVFE
jgi:hypothetical protein